MNADDLLSFKEYSPVHESHVSTGRAEININSPSRPNPYGRPAQTPPTPNDPLQDLMNSLGTSVNVLHNEDRNMQINNNGKPIHHCNSIPMLLCDTTFSTISFITVTPDDTTERSPSHSFFTIEYYQQFFNVDTAIVLDRIASSMIPKRAPVNYVKQHIGSNPDLYGPFWIVVTLVRIEFRKISSKISLIVILPYRYFQ